VNYIIFYFAIKAAIDKHKNNDTAEIHLYSVRVPGCQKLQLTA